MKITHLRHILQTKGGLHALERTGQVLWRFACGRRRFERMCDLLEREWDPDVKITFCVAASLLKRHQDLIRRVYRMGHAIAAHGYYHSRMDILDREHQRQIVERSREAFRKADIEVDGFRCPCLNYNDDTLDVLQHSVFSWTSQRLVFWENGFNPGLRRLLSIYQASMAQDCMALPIRDCRIVDVPITAPDDEMFVERYRIRSQEKMRQIWTEVLDQTVERGEVFHLLFHPERFFLVHRAIQAVLTYAKQSAERVWFTTLPQLADWWALRDSCRWEISEHGAGVRAWIGPLPRQARVIKKKTDSKGIPGWQIAQPCAERNDRVGFDLGESPYPLIGLSPSCPEEVERYLVSEGFLVKRSDEPDHCAIFLNGDATVTSTSEQLQLLEKLEVGDNSLLRLSRWPENARSAVTVSSDVDSITLRDFVERAIHF